MRAELDLAVLEPATVRQAVAPSLRSSEAVRFEVDAGETLGIIVEADRIGPLRGGVNTALMLTRLASRTLDR